ncbi:MAG: hypothetical protein A2521_07175 [Deltaproteobacteria bacterium RIFOXYD12_FULL_57_12]|nr:MAG: hypothetical protein A2521_07175 [Deltaproteobacteria bacterium RIFOXYD12_FULL_57_12]
MRHVTLLLAILLAGLFIHGLWGCAGRSSTPATPTSQAARPETRPLAERPGPGQTPAAAIPAEPAPETADTPPESDLSSHGPLDPRQCYDFRPAGGKGRCEPQSIPYCRCRSDIDTCRLGHENGPLTWFACEEKRGNTSSEPRPGSILVLAANSRRGMPTGHTFYVEAVYPEGTSTYRLILSHTNHDRKCSLEIGTEALYDRTAMTLDMLTGAWKNWGRGLRLAGFILD